MRSRKQEQGHTLWMRSEITRAECKTEDMGLVGRVASSHNRRNLVQYEMFESIMDTLESH